MYIRDMDYFIIAQFGYGQKHEPKHVHINKDSRLALFALQQSITVAESENRKSEVAYQVNLIINIQTYRCFESI